MRVKCLHGYFKFFEKKVGDISNFMNLTGLELSAKDDYFTFSSLIDAPKYSLAGKTILDFVAIKTFEGEPWEVFEQNSIVYDFMLDQVLSILTVFKFADLIKTGNRYYSPGLILPGSLLSNGSKIKSYTAYWDRTKWLYSEVDFV